MTCLAGNFSRVSRVRGLGGLTRGCVLALGVAACSGPREVPVPRESVPAATRAGSPPPTPEPAEAGNVVVFFGDSLTAGQGVDAHQAYPAVVGKRLEASARPWKMINAGVNGDTTSTAAARIDWVLRTQPTVLFVCLGANDGLRGIAPDETERNLRQIIQRARDAGVAVVLAGMQMPGNYGSEHAAAFAAVYPRLADAFDLPFVPFLLEGVALEPSLNQADGIHPNVAGHQKIAAHVWPQLDAALREHERAGGGN
ncbi:MAG: arylesterase [Myxococcales bacterium FL481]|nr:MAG: arylesterase [Myxococcales bacterium FL481]